VEGQFIEIDISNRQPLRERYIREDTPEELAVKSIIETLIQ
jgi:hypothetical protein